MYSIMIEEPEQNEICIRCEPGKRMEIMVVVAVLGGKRIKTQRTNASPHRRRAGTPDTDPYLGS